MAQLPAAATAAAAAPVHHDQVADQGQDVITGTGSQTHVLGRLVNQVVSDSRTRIPWWPGHILEFQRFLAEHRFNTLQIKSADLNAHLRQLAARINLDPNRLTPIQWQAVREKMRTSLLYRYNQLKDQGQITEVWCEQREAMMAQWDTQAVERILSPAWHGRHGDVITGDGDHNDGTTRELPVISEEAVSPPSPPSPPPVPALAQDPGLRRNQVEEPPRERELHQQDNPPPPIETQPTPAPEMEADRPQQSLRNTEQQTDEGVEEVEEDTVQGPQRGEHVGGWVPEVEWEEDEEEQEQEQEQEHVSAGQGDQGGQGAVEQRRWDRLEDERNQEMEEPQPEPEQGQDAEQMVRHPHEKQHRRRRARGKRGAKGNRDRAKDLDMDGGVPISSPASSTPTKSPRVIHGSSRPTWLHGDRESTSSPVTQTEAALPVTPTKTSQRRSGRGTALTPDVVNTPATGTTHDKPASAVASTPAPSPSLPPTPPATRRPAHLPVARNHDSDTAAAPSTPTRHVPPIDDPSLLGSPPNLPLTPPATRTPGHHTKRWWDPANLRPGTRTLAPSSPTRHITPTVSSPLGSPRQLHSPGGQDWPDQKAQNHPSLSRTQVTRPFSHSSGSFESSGTLGLSRWRWPGAGTDQPKDQGITPACWSPGVSPFTKAPPAFEPKPDTNAVKAGLGLGPGPGPGLGSAKSKDTPFNTSRLGSSQQQGIGHKQASNRTANSQAVSARTWSPRVIGGSGDISGGGQALPSPLDGLPTRSNSSRPVVQQQPQNQHQETILHPQHLANTSFGTRDDIETTMSLLVACDKERSLLLDQTLIGLVNRWGGGDGGILPYGLVGRGIPLAAEFALVECRGRKTRALEVLALSAVRGGQGEGWENGVQGSSTRSAVYPVGREERLIRAEGDLQAGLGVFGKILVGSRI